MKTCCGLPAGTECACRADVDVIVAAITAYVRRRVAHPQDAEDVVQDTMVRLYRSADGLRDAAAFNGWMYRLARSAVIDHYRRVARGAVPTDPLLIESTAEAEVAPAAETELAACLPALLARLPDTYRRALELTDLGGRTQVAAAAETGLSVSGMKSRVQRGRALLRSEIRRCCEVVLDARGGIAEATVRADRRDRAADSES